jgi:inosine-uridine nucleoside N-ribohydrolase
VKEFNMQQDLLASQTIFNCGVPLIYLPCLGVTSHLLTTRVELEDTIAGRNAISDFLYQRFCEYSSDHFAWAKEIWDISAIAYLLNEAWIPTMLSPSPVLNDNFTYTPPPPGRHMVREAWFVRRNQVFRDLFTKLQNYSG